MRNRQIQEERIKTYFLDAAKNLLRAEGLKGVSVRNVAYRAGYSYATLYNYFKDINDLLFRCVEDFCQEVGDFVAARTEGGAPGREGLRRTARAYVEGLRCMLPGMLLLYENRLAPDNYEEFMQSVDAQLGRVID